MSHLVNLSDMECLPEPYGIGNQSAIDAKKVVAQYRRFLLFLINNGFLAGQDIETVVPMSGDCSTYLQKCDFESAQQCIEVEQVSWAAFMVYLPFACVLLTIALIFNVVSAVIVCSLTKEVNKKVFPRHILLVNLSISDSMLSAFTLIKRAVDFLPSNWLGNVIKQRIVVYNNMIWQACWIVSAFGLLFLAVDCIVCTSLPFAYGQPTSVISTAVAVSALWSSALVFTGLLVFFDLSYEGIVQYIICGLMLVILMVVAAGCAYICVVTERIRRRHMFARRRSLFDDAAVKNMRQSRFRSTATIGFIVASSFVSWLPLVVYFSVVDEQFYNDHLIVSHATLVFGLICFHINAVANPVIYSWRCKDVKERLQRECTRRKFLRKWAPILFNRDSTTSSTTRVTGDLIPFHRRSSGTAVLPRQSIILPLENITVASSVERPVLDEATQQILLKLPEQS